MAGAGAEQGVPAPEEWRDWAGLPEELLVKVAGTLVAQTEAGWAAQLEGWSYTEEDIQEAIEERKRDGNCLFVFARVCKEWRKAQLKVGGRLCSRVWSDVIMPGRVALAKWALAEGCPREEDGMGTLAEVAAEHGHLELVKWLCGEGGFAMDGEVMQVATLSGNQELVQWLLREGGFAMDEYMMEGAHRSGNQELVRWMQAEGCPEF